MKLWKWIVIVSLALQALIVGPSAIFNLSDPARSFSLMGVDVIPEFVGIMVANLFLFMTVICLLGVWCAWKNQSIGYILGVCLGGYLALMAFVPLVLADNTDLLFIDGPRGLLLVVAGVIGIRKLPEA